MNQLQILLTKIIPSAIVTSVIVGAIALVIYQMIVFHKKAITVKVRYTNGELKKIKMMPVKAKNLIDKKTVSAVFFGPGRVSVEKDEKGHISSFLE